jgi:hypothetical protein
MNIAAVVGCCVIGKRRSGLTYMRKPFANHLNVFLVIGQFIMIELLAKLGCNFKGTFQIVNPVFVIRYFSPPLILKIKNSA